MKKVTLFLAGIVSIIGFFGANSSFAKSLSVQPLAQGNQNVGEEEQVKSVLNEKIQTTCILGNGIVRAEGKLEYTPDGYVKPIDRILTTPAGIYLPYALPINYFPFHLAQHNSRAFDLAGIVSETTIYTIQRRSDENMGDYFVYDFYVAYNGSKPFKDGNDILFAVNEAQEKVTLPPPSNTEDLAAWDWYLAGLEIRVAKRLSAKDFEGISKGATIEDVISVDPTTAISLPNEEGWNKWVYDPLKFDTFHYTDNGILRITFSRESTDDDFLVGEIEMNETFEVSCDGGSATNGQPTVKLKINPEHLPD